MSQGVTSDRYLSEQTDGRSETPRISVYPQNVVINNTSTNITSFSSILYNS